MPVPMWRFPRASTLKLPVEWVKGTKLFLAAVDAHRPVIIVSAGVASKLSEMR